MYHISNDKRTKQSAKLIWNGLLKCLESKSFYDITVTDLQKASGIARSTFYRCFDNISDILFWKCDISFYEALNISDIKEFTNEFSLAKNYFTYWLNNSEILELLIQINRQDIIYSCHLKNAEMLQEKFGKLDIPQNHTKYFMAIRTSLTIGILTAWVTNRKKRNSSRTHTNY